MDIGGDGAIGTKWTDEQRKKQSLRLIGNQFRKGIPHDEESRKKMSIAQRNQTEETSQQKLADLFVVSRGVIRDILAGRTYFEE